jgi:hypothetical protein
LAHLDRCLVSAQAGAGIREATGLGRRSRGCSADNLFPPSTTWIAVGRGSYRRRYAYRFIELCSGAMSEKLVRKEAMLSREPA